jgi:hypothetical protein
MGFGPRLAAAIDLALRQGVSFLSRAQLPSGELPVRAFAKPTLEGSGRPDASIFATTFCLHTLEQLHTAEVPVPQATLARGRRFLLGEMSGPGLFAYYTRTHVARLPPDTDDTCCASAVLRRAHPFLMWGENLAALLRSRDTTGRFLTWIEPFDGPNRVDPGVNANALLYLGDRPETRVASKFVRRALVQEDPVEDAGYYPDWLVLAYLVWRAWRGGAGSLSEAVAAAGRRADAAQRTDGSFGGDVRTACAVALLSSPPARRDALRAGVEVLLERQGRDGSWAPGLVYRSMDEFFGSEALTTALCLDALAAARGTLAGEPARGGEPATTPTRPDSDDRSG